MKTAIVIPARLESTRLPRKLLLDQTGKTLIEHTYGAAKTSQLADDVFVATDSEKIFQVVESFGGKALMTSLDHKSGTDRTAEVAAKIDAQWIVNVQGDEPEIAGESIDTVFKRMLDHEAPVIATLATPIVSPVQMDDPASVKVVFDGQNRALYFSRSPIPMARDKSFVENYFSNERFLDKPVFFQHVGVYGYHRSFLEKISTLSASPAEQIESLEQLRFLHNGWPIFVDVVNHTAAGIDTAEDYALFVNRQRNG